MFRYRVGLVLAVPVFLALSSGVPAQDQNPDVKKLQQAEDAYKQALLKQEEEEYRQSYKKPETPMEFWVAMNFEIDVGRLGLAAKLVKDLLDVTKGDDEALWKIEEHAGLSAFLRLRTVPSWVDDPTLPKTIQDKIDKETRANVEELIGRVTKTVKDHLADPDRFKRLMDNLMGDTENRKYAFVELRRSGAAVVPFLVEELQTTTDPDRQERILDLLVRLDKRIVPPLLAALDLPDPALQITLLGVLEKRAQTDATPTLWYLSASPQVADTVRQEARRALSAFLRIEEDKLPPAKLELTREAERYYQHQGTIPDTREEEVPAKEGETKTPGKKTALTLVDVWQGDRDKKVLEKKSMTISEAEEYFGLRFARRALDLDPAYQPAQVVFLSLALEKAFERGGLDQPLDKGGAGVKELLKVVDPDLVIIVLNRALADHRLPVILGTVRTLGDLGEVRAARQTSHGDSVLVRALNYPDRRVQMAAAEGLLRLPGPPAPGASARLVEVLRRNLVASPTPTVLVAHTNPVVGHAIVEGAQKAGYAAAADPNTGETLFRSGRTVMKRVKEAADIDVLLIDYALPDPQLPYLLGQLRADNDAGLLPVLVTVPPELAGTVPTQTAQDLRREVEHYRNAWVIPETLSPEGLKEILEAKILAAMGRPLSAAERKANQGTAMLFLKRMATGEVQGYDVTPAQDAIFQALANDELAPLAIEATAHLPGADPQYKLNALVMDSKRPVPLRSAAAIELAQHIQHFGLALTGQQMQAIIDFFESPEGDPKLKANVARVVGTIRSTRPNGILTGKRLGEYFPPAPPAPAKEK